MRCLRGGQALDVEVPISTVRNWVTIQLKKNVLHLDILKSFVDKALGQTGKFPCKKIVKSLYNNQVTF